MEHTLTLLTALLLTPLAALQCAETPLTQATSHVIVPAQQVEALARRGQAVQLQRILEVQS